MDFDNAIGAHVQWKAKLSSYIAHPDHTLNANMAAGDQNCELGKWLHGEGKRYANIPEYVALVKDHAQFHRAAGEVIRKADSGQKVLDEVALGANSDFANASTAVVADLMKIKRVV